MKNGDNKKDSVFSSLINKFYKKSDSDKTLNSNNSSNINNTNTNNSSYFNNKNQTSANELGKIKTETELKESNSSSKSLEIIKQKKLSRLGLTDGSVSKKLASDNIDYEPVFK